MSPIKNISIPTPCHQSWQQMQPVDTGRHCTACAKTVIDFSHMTNEQIISHLSSSTNICGRFAPFQLQSINNVMAGDDRPVGFKRWIMVLGMFGLVMFLRAGAQTKSVSAPVTQQDTTKNSRSSDIIMGKALLVPPQIRTISGVVTDENNQPLPGAVIYTYTGGPAVQTDLNGRFRLQLRESAQRITVKYIGFINQIIPINAEADSAYVVKLRESSVTLGEIAVVKKTPFVKRMYYRYVRRPIRSIFRHKKRIK